MINNISYIDIGWSACAKHCAKPFVGIISFISPLKLLKETVL